MQEKSPILKRLMHWSGMIPGHVSLKEKIIAGLGGFIAIACILSVGLVTVGYDNATLIVASMGASAVLLFAVPHGALSQPWALAGGHLISAVCGVTVALLVHDLVLGAGLAVGMAIFLMYLLNCIHPPGGATALTAVVGSQHLHDLGYQFVITPVLVNVIIILSIAIAFNYLFRWRRYPAAWQQYSVKQTHQSDVITHEDFISALSELDSFIDITEQDMMRIYDLVMLRHEQSAMPLTGIKLGSYYSNGKYGADWSVRQIIDESPDSDTGESQVIFKVIIGAGRRSTAVVSRDEFSRWAKYEVYRDEENWRRVTHSDAVEKTNN